jgi:hypothetical protein
MRSTIVVSVSGSAAAQLMPFASRKRAIISRSATRLLPSGRGMILCEVLHEGRSLFDRREMPRFRQRTRTAREARTRQAVSAAAAPQQLARGRE